MKIKSYFCDSVEHAVAAARKELGPDAVILNSRRNRGSNDPAQRYEVVFGLEESVRQDTAPKPQVDPLAEIREQIRELRESFSAAAAGRRGNPANAVVESWRERLGAQDISASCIRQILDQALAGSAGSRLSEAALEKALCDALSRTLTVADPFAEKGGMAALVGPPGAGKTSLIAKLAVRCGVSRRRSVLIVAADPLRVGSSEQLQVYASVLGAAFCHATDFVQLSRALKNEERRDLVLVDTPGYSFREGDLLAEQADCFRHFRTLRTHLVLPVSLRTAELERYAVFYEPFGPQSLMFTRLEETDLRGPVVSLADATKLPVSYVSGGQSIPEDLQLADAASLIAGMVPRKDRVECVA